MTFTFSLKVVIAGSFRVSAMTDYGMPGQLSLLCIPLGLSFLQSSEKVPVLLINAQHRDDLLGSALFAQSSVLL